MKTQQHYREAAEILLGDFIARLTSEPHNLEQVQLMIAALEITIERLKTRWKIECELTENE